MEKKKAKVISFIEDTGVWVLQVEGIKKEMWLFPRVIKASKVSIELGDNVQVTLSKNDKGFDQIDEVFSDRKFQPQPFKPNTPAPTMNRPNITFDQNTNFQIFTNKQKNLFQKKGDKYEFKYDSKVKYSAFNSGLLGQIHANQVVNASILFRNGKVEQFEPTLKQRLAVGLGSASVFETSISLHHVYGVPFIPSSSVKGIIRSWVIQSIYGTEISAGEIEKKHSLVNAEFRALTQDVDFCDIFGCPSEIKAVKFDANGEPEKNQKGNYNFHQATSVALRNKQKSTEGEENKGKVTFLDAFPYSENLVVEPDIMNPHYGDYYSNDNIPPADYLSPVPIIFLTVGKDAKFNFIFGVKRKEDEVYLETTKSWLESALKEHGIGAKTAVGYGYMKQ